MKGIKCIGLLTLFITLLLSFGIYSDVSAASAQVNQADVLFYNSYHGQFDATVNLPWSANVGGSASDTVDFFINRVSMLFPIQAQASATNIYGRLVMRFTPAFTSSETAYFCDKKLNDYTSSVESISISCPGSITYYYSDGTSFTSTLPLFFNYSLPSGALNVYTDYSQVLPSVSLTGIRFTIAKTGNYDVYSVLNGYQLVLTTLVSDASYFITDPTTGSGTDISPLVNQNQVIINQNQTIIEQDAQDREDLQDGVDDAELQADNAGQQFETGIAPLTTIIGNFVNIILNPPARDCTINGNVGIGGFDMGTIDLCELSPPPAVQIIATLLLIGFIIPFAYSLILTLLNILQNFVEGS